MCVDLASGAAEIVRSARRDGMAVAAKSTPTDLVTEIDRASERWLLAEITGRRPDDAVLGEEGGDRDGSSGVRWLLDPIDGTVNFVLGMPYYAVSVAVEVDGFDTAAAVVNPVSGEVFHARRGGGAYLGDEQLHGPRTVALDQAVIATGFSYDATMRARQMAVAAQLVARVGDLRRFGAAALDLCFLAAGRYDGYYEAGLQPWDHAGGGLIAAEAGCATSGLHGKAPSGQLYAACGAALAPQFFALLESLGAGEAGS